MNEIQFSNIDLVKNVDNTFIAILPEQIKSKKELFNVLCSILIFPEYFGYNWDALSDCLKDFNWISEKNINLIHRDLPCLSFQDKKQYLEILIDSVKAWEVDDVHCFQVFFPVETENNVKVCLS